jgi:putative NADPH-quinone reductase
MKKIVIIDCHPNPNSFNAAVAQTYMQAASTAGAEVKQIVIRQLQFNLNLQHGYQQRIELEPDLLAAWDKIQWADHMVWVHPVWWGGLPAISKGFIDRLFLPGMAFRYRENSVWWDKLLTGKSAHIITTLDQPSIYYSLVFGKPSVHQLRDSTLKFCGVNPVKVTYLGPIRNSKLTEREAMLKKVQQLGRALK